ncbi:MAG: DUF2238 domain-containing protein [Phycisphaeraceae bacterium]|nr:DUF2238 domain-containing protein [Phycisphaerales bacterium]MCB9861253.1 DUF2238 domain-containing protein [Phycisphaeraceae bacterium]
MDNTMSDVTAQHPMPKSIVLFVVACIVVFGALALYQGSTEFIIYTVMTIVEVVVVMVIHRRVGLPLHVLWLLAVWALLHLAGGTVHIDPELTKEGNKNVLYALRLHSWLPRYDQIVHMFGFFSATLTCGHVLLRSVRPISAAPDSMPKGYTAIIMCSMLAGMGLGALNEVAEFIITLIDENNGVGGYENTGWDLVSNTVGAFAGGVLLHMSKASFRSH